MMEMTQVLARAPSQSHGKEGPLVAPRKPKVGYQRVRCIDWNVLRRKGRL